MYLKFATNLEFPTLAKALCADLSEDAIDWDSENVYEWMYVDLPQLGFSLNVSREHGWADIADKVLDRYENNREELKHIVQPGPVYIFGWNRTTANYVDDLPDSLALFVADRLEVDVFVYSGRANVDIADPEPLTVGRPNADQS